MGVLGFERGGIGDDVGDLADLGSKRTSGPRCGDEPRGRAEQDALAGVVRLDRGTQFVEGTGLGGVVEVLCQADDDPDAAYEPEGVVGVRAEVDRLAIGGLPGADDLSDEVIANVRDALVLFFRDQHRLDRSRHVPRILPWRSRTGLRFV